jgi:hypothetical protein
MIMFGIFPNIWRMFVKMMEGAAHELTSPPFDVRNGIPEAELDDESIQLLYDAVNRMVVLIGEIPSSRLFLAPICEIGLLVAPRVTIAARYGLLREPALVETVNRGAG